MSNVLFQAGFLVLALLCGYFFGKLAERRHYKSIREREARLSRLPAVATKYPPEHHLRQQLMTGSVVVASDYFKRFLAGLISLFGGRVTPFETLLDRARREALLRLKEQAETQGASYVFNVKYETSRVLGGGSGGAIEVLAYGTALLPTQDLGQFASPLASSTQT